MTSSDMILAVRVEGGSGTDSLEEQRLTEQLRRRLLELDVAQVRLARSADRPPGAKAGEAITQGALLVTLAPAALSGVLNLVQTWLHRNTSSSVELSLPGRTIKLSGARPRDTQRLLEEFMEADASRNDGSID